MGLIGGNLAAVDDVVGELPGDLPAAAEVRDALP
jgi:hypothetical protein